ncbi:hypothetical protein [Pseudonocardia kunmingensis]|uniref:Chromatin associated protein KTI12 n=1 Tax=Pseudonocardia kunmingensis TaxID=630975 RepID=A0A543DWE1_9PSEU|nr:hypothetical protein [Pseudonocardia kunmingensis]TQM13589.1 chromatin associated protein KTI12 [Pseudonocardia kunmingensis]
MSVLVVLAGLPGSGKSALARPLARRLRAALVVVDLLEDAASGGCRAVAHRLRC